ncbi:MAG: D-glycero-beta-D-manno-heptose 1-phosphate adenylyltransferase [Bacteroidales bacterium]|nr:D-glycero-beta-D-manno-heptose 1-phosphate adenylyltransferase [Bacteroidales bacterium]
MNFNSTLYSKIFQYNETAELLSKIDKKINSKLVFTNGCFDILHSGHADYLSKARDLGDILVVGLNSDQSVQRIKGKLRPIVSERNRAILLAAMSFVDFVIFFNEDTPFELIQTIKPDILVKGGDYSIDTIVGADLVKSMGGEVSVIPFLDGFSSTDIINKIKNQ